MYKLGRSVNVAGDKISSRTLVVLIILPLVLGGAILSARARPTTNSEQPTGAIEAYKRLLGTSPVLRKNKSVSSDRKFSVEISKKYDSASNTFVAKIEILKGDGSPEKLTIATSSTGDDGDVDYYLLDNDGSSSISPDGQFVLFFGLREASEIGNLPRGRIYLFDLKARTTRVISESAVYLGGRNAVKWFSDSQRFVYGDPASVQLFEMNSNKKTRLASRYGSSDPAEGAAYNFVWGKNGRLIYYTLLPDARCCEALKIEPSRLKNSKKPLYRIIELKD